MGAQIILTVSAIAVVLVAVYKIFIQQIFLSSLSKIPAAHPTSHFSPLWIYYIRWSNIENKTLYELHKKKGPILRLAPNELSVNSYEEGLKTIYTGGFEKTGFYFRRFASFNGLVSIHVSLLDTFTNLETGSPICSV